MPLVQHQAGQFANRIREFAISGSCGCSFFLPLILWPGLEQPFSTPKWWLLGAWSGMLLLLLFSLHLDRSLTRLPTMEMTLLATWLAAISISSVTAPVVSLRSLLCTLAPVPWFLALRLIPGLSGQLTPIWRWTSAVLSLLVILQYLGMDPFIHWFHWQPEQFPGSRMRVYGTLGNPNFVAAWLCATLPFHLPLCLGDGWKKSKRRSMAVILLAIQLLAILAAGSRVFPVAMGILLLTLLLLARRRIFLIALPVALVSMVLLFLMSPTRSLGTTLAGRWFIAGTILEHWKEIPFFGFGPGAFPEQFARWQNEWLQVTAVGNPQLRFAGPLDHAHNDYLELLVNFGYAGLAAFLAFCLPLFRDFIKSKAGSADKLLLAARLSPPLILLAIALVDFPFQRPAEWGLFWLLRGTAHEQVLREKEDRGG